MSIQVMSYLWKHSQQKGSALLLLLAIGDHAHDDGGGAYPSVTTLAKKVRMTTRNTRILLSKLEAAGELHIEHSAGVRGVNLYTIPLKSFPPEEIRDTPEIPGAAPLKGLSAKPSENHQRTIREEERVDAATGEILTEKQTFLALFVTVWEQEMGQPVTPLLVEELRDLEERYPGLDPTWAADAIKEAVLNNARSLKYILTILERWATEGKGNHKKATVAGLQKSADPQEYLRRYGHLAGRAQ